MTDAELAEIEWSLGPFRAEENGDEMGEPEWQATISMQQARRLVAEVRRLRNVESAALAWRGVARCPDHAETMYWCDSCVRSEDADEALADALNAKRGGE